MSSFAKIIILIIMSLMALNAQTSESVTDTSDTSKSKPVAPSVQKSDSESGENVLGIFLRSLLEKEKDENSDSSRKYDYFQDNNSNGVDDRFESTKIRNQAGTRTPRKKQKANPHPSNAQSAGNND